MASEEEPWLRREMKRQSGVAAVKLSPDYAIVSKLEDRGRQRTPNPTDRTVSK